MLLAAKSIGVPCYQRKVETVGRDVQRSARYRNEEEDRAEDEGINFRQGKIRSRVS